MIENKLKKILGPRKLNSDKRDYGHVLVLAGSVGLTGAAYLASTASCLSGSGLVTLGIPSSLNPIMEVKLTEAMTLPLPQTKEASLSEQALGKIKLFLKNISAVALGPGISRNQQTQKLVQKLLPVLDKPTVLDADGINAVVGKVKILDKFKNQLIITPHAGEFARLLNINIKQVQKNRAMLASDFARKHGVIVVLKGQRTIVASPDKRLYINQTGNPGMASGGCGDVLCGMIASFLGQGIEAFRAAELAVYLHGLAGDYAAKEKTQSCLLATDILNSLPQAFKKLAK